MTTRSPAELEPEIEASRQALAADVAALRERATPRRLMGDAVDTARARGRQVGRRILKRASSDRLWLSVVGGLIVAGGSAYLISRLVAGRRPTRQEIVAANLARVAQPVGAALAGGGAWMAARSRKVGRSKPVKVVVARVREPIAPLLRRVAPRKQGLRAYLPMMR